MRRQAALRAFSLVRRRRLGFLRKRRMAIWALLGICVLVAAPVIFFGVRQLVHPRMDGSDVAQVEFGGRIYAEACASCHGASLEGQLNWQNRLPDGRLLAPPLNASGRVWQLSDQVLFAISKKGPAAYPLDYQTDMPAFGGRLTDEEIAAAVAFVKSTWPADIRARHVRRNLNSWNARH